MSILDLLKKASEIAGRDIEIDETVDGQYIVLYMDFNSPPPKKGKTEIEALQNFIHMMESKEIQSGSNIGIIGTNS